MKILFAWIKDGILFLFPFLGSSFYWGFFFTICFKFADEPDPNFHEELFVTCYSSKWSLTPVGHS